MTYGLWTPCRPALCWSITRLPFLIPPTIYEKVWGALATVILFPLAVPTLLLLWSNVNVVELNLSKQPSWFIAVHVPSNVLLVVLPARFFQYADRRGIYIQIYTSVRISKLNDLVNYDFMFIILNFDFKIGSMFFFFLSRIILSSPQIFLLILFSSL